MDSISFVKVPIDIRSTPVSAMATIEPRVIPPDASNNARLLVSATASFISETVKLSSNIEFALLSRASFNCWSDSTST